MKRNLTEGPIAQTLIMFSLPLLGTNVLQSLNFSANQFWVAHILGVTAITAIGNANVVSMLAQGAIFGATMAANILIAQSVGAGDMRMVKRVMGTAISFFFVLSIILAFCGWTFAPHILAGMRTPPAARMQAILYLRIVFSAMPFMYFFMFIQMAQRGAGDSRTPFYFMALAVVLDIILNPLLIAGIGPFPKLGIAGSAVSTLIGQSVSLMLLLVHLYRKHSVLMLRPHELGLLKPDWHILRPLLVRGLPMSLQMFVMSGAAMVMVGFVNGYGAVTSAAYIGAQQVWNYIQMPGMAVGASISSMAGQNVGAGRWDQVSRIAGIGILQRRRHRHLRDHHLSAGPAAALHLPAAALADHSDRVAHQSYGAVGLRDLQRHLRPDRHRAVDRRGLAASGHTGLFHAGHPRAVRLVLHPTFRGRGDLVELPAGHPDLEPAVGALLQVRRLAEGAHDHARSRRPGS